VSPDPLVQTITLSQSHNRYSYVLNNPLRYIDPSGYGWLSDFFEGVGDAVGDVFDAVIGKPLKWVGEQLHKAGKWLQENWQTVAIIAATVVLGPAGSYATAFLIGAAIGGFSAVLYGGSFEDVLRGAVLGGVSAALFYGVGTAGIENQLLAAGAHGVVGGTTAVLQGGEFGTGFAAAAFAKYSGSYVDPDAGATYQVASAAAIGGTVAALSGGSFENGAITGAFSRMFNDLSHGGAQSKSWMMKLAEWWRGDDVNRTISAYSWEIAEAAAATGIDKNLVKAILFEEQSHLTPFEATLERLGAGKTVGLGQLTVGKFGSRTDLLDPRTNINVMTSHLTSIARTIPTPFGHSAYIEMVATRYNCSNCIGITNYGRRVHEYWHRFGGQPNDRP
jgi:hypothetical protein